MEKQINILVLVAIAKLFNEQSTFLIGELEKDKKHWFNLSVNAADNFVKSIEKSLNDFDRETLEILTDSMHDGVSNLKKELISNLKNG